VLSTLKELFANRLIGMEKIFLIGRDLAPVRDDPMALVGLLLSDKGLLSHVGKDPGELIAVHLHPDGVHSGELLG
jgi:hypothetical protein